ncbi:oxaloacetate-decarboxylating malate dehydrogenase [Streptomyces poonensis]|uniref:Malate dehydrogenase n=1 Tax=Streptomyces poonensis TaxID=68255 RepID=A0A918UY88_9ACTN|nr:oxaloacetate-decarboxylating malate dehydrogenase [Streptomyces poonensis]GGZ41548.1 hypothetical protein GCM10010365_72840 [Streptomyces poonensis]
MLDAGTNRPELLDNPLYLGIHHKRVDQETYDFFIDAYVDTAATLFPNALLHWEDFGPANARRILDRYRHKAFTFNDDIQGTGAVNLAAVLAGVHATDLPLAEHRIVIFGAGSAGIGIADQLREALITQGLRPEQATGRILAVDRHGLLTEGQHDMRDFQLRYARRAAEVDDWRYDAEAGGILLDEVVARVRPTILIGTSGQGGAFTEDIVRAMASHTDRPIILPMSNPTRLAEAVPADLLAWTQGRALIATGSPFGPVEHEGVTYQLGQANNALVFPGLGLGAIVAKADRVTDATLHHGSARRRKTDRRHSRRSALPPRSPSSTRHPSPWPSPWPRPPPATASPVPRSTRTPSSVSAPPCGSRSTRRSRPLTHRRPATSGPPPAARQVRGRAQHRLVQGPIASGGPHTAWRERITGFCPPGGSKGGVSGRTGLQEARIGEAAGTASPYPLEETALDPEVEMLIETDSDAYALWKALSLVVATHPLAPRPVSEDTAAVYLSVMGAEDLGHRTRVPLAGRRLSKALLGSVDTEPCSRRPLPSINVSRGREVKSAGSSWTALSAEPSHGATRCPATAGVQVSMHRPPRRARHFCPAGMPPTLGTASSQIPREDRHFHLALSERATDQSVQARARLRPGRSASRRRARCPERRQPVKMKWV